MCEVLKVSRSSYYRWYTIGPSKRFLENILFRDLIKHEFDLSKGTYGSPRIKEALNRKEHCISKRRVAKLMKENGWRSKIKKRYKVTTHSNHSYPICRNHLDRNFTPERLNQAWVSDITYIKTAKGWLYLTTIIDLYDRQVIGWSLSNRLYTNQTIVPACRMTLSKRKITEPLLFHSDRGIQYAYVEFKKFLKANYFYNTKYVKKSKLLG